MWALAKPPRREEQPNWLRLKICQDYSQNELGINLLVGPRVISFLLSWSHCDPYGRFVHGKHPPQLEGEVAERRVGRCGRAGEGLPAEAAAAREGGNSWRKVEELDDAGGRRRGSWSIGRRLGIWGWLCVTGREDEIGDFFLFFSSFFVQPHVQKRTRAKVFAFAHALAPLRGYTERAMPRTLGPTPLRSWMQISDPFLVFFKPCRRTACDHYKR